MNSAVDTPGHPPAIAPAAHAHELIQHLTQLWAEMLGEPDCPPHASFMDLGGDSISATLLVSRIRERWQVNLPLHDMFDGMTIERMASLIQAGSGSPPSATLPPIERHSRGQPLPLSHSQRRMWLVQSFAPDTTGYNVTFALRLDGPLHLPHLQQAVEMVWARHDTFRTRFVTTPQGPRQIVAPVSEQPALALPCIDLSGLPVEDRLEAAQKHLHAAAATPFSLTEAPPWRMVLLKLDEQAHILAWVAHHILVDLWANLNLARELAQVYNHLQGRAPLQLPEVVLDCADLGHWQTSPAVQAQLEPQLAYWLTQLADLPPSNLAFDQPLRDDWYRSAKRLELPLPDAWRSRLLRCAAQTGHTPFMIMLAGLSLLLGRQSRQDDVAVVTPIANRQHAQTEHIVASLTNTLVMRTRLPAHLTFLELLDQVKQTTLGAFAHQDLPFDLLVERMAHQSRMNDLPLGLQVMLNVANAPSDGVQFEGLRAQRVLLDRRAPQFPLTLIVDLEMTCTVVLEYADRLFHASSAQAFVDHFLLVIERALIAPTEPLGALHWLSPASASALTHWNDTQQVLPDFPSVDALLRAQTAATPDAIACECDGQRLSYAALHAQAETLAAALQARGIGRGHRVGLNLPRGLQQLVALRAVLMTGAAYVPLDPRFPADRLRSMAQDADLSLVLSERWQPGPDWPHPPAGLNPASVPQTGQHPAFAATSPPTATDPAYIIYTSGSTGRPKGVVVPNRSVVNFLLSMARQPGLQGQDVLLAVTTLSFDIAVLELLLPLSVGAKLILASDDQVMDGHALQSLITQHNVSVLQATPATWRALLDAGWAGQPGLKALVGGEALSPELAQRLLPRCGALWNMYGPTETTVWSSCWQVQAPEQDIYIGRPIAHTRIRIIDQHGHECAIGSPGEIVIEGEGVALGYWRRDELTADRFLFDPAHPERPPCAYKTGDLGRWTWHGQLEHLGRLDHQIKVRGFRIEPGDIETQLLAHPEVSQCVVITREDQPGDVRLVAYVVRHGGGAPTLGTSAWREYLRRALPEYMVPQHIVELPALPLLANGKLNRQALPPPAATAHTEPASTATPLTPWEARLATVWRELLGMARIQPHDNFFDLGGHSLMAMQAISQMADQTGVRVSPRRYIFESLSQLAASYERASTTANSPDMVDNAVAGTAAGVSTSLPEPKAKEAGQGMLGRLLKTFRP